VARAGAQLEVDCEAVKADCAASCGGAPALNACDRTDGGFTSECACEGGEDMQDSAILGDIMSMHQVFASVPFASMDGAVLLEDGAMLLPADGSLPRMDRMDSVMPVPATAGLQIVLSGLLQPLVNAVPVSFPGAFYGWEGPVVASEGYGEGSYSYSYYPYSYDKQGRWVTFSDLVGGAYSYLYDGLYPYGELYAYEEAMPCDHDASMVAAAAAIQEGREDAMAAARQQMLAQQAGPRALDPRDPFPEDDADSRPWEVPKQARAIGADGRPQPPPPPPGAVILAGLLVAGTFATLVSMCMMCARAARRAEAAQQLVDVAAAAPLLSDEGAAIVVNPVHQGAYEAPASVVYVTVDVPSPDTPPEASQQ